MVPYSFTQFEVPYYSSTVTFILGTSSGVLYVSKNPYISPEDSTSYEQKCNNNCKIDIRNVEKGTVYHIFATFLVQKRYSISAYAYYPV